MKTKIKVLILVLSAISLSAMSQRITDVSSIYNSHIIIYGTSNVTDYSCKLYDLSNNKKLVIESEVHGKNIQLKNAKVNLNTSSFSCDNRVMTSEFYDAIKGDSFPVITVEFHEFTLNQEVAVAPIQNDISSKFSITLANVTKTYNSTISSINVESDKLTLDGSIEVYMSEFGIHPPSAMMGMIQTGDKIQIEFSITFIFL